jgi:hypothetical protein
MNRSSKKLVGDGKPHERRHPLEGGGVRITTFVPFHFKKRGIKKVIVAPEGVSQPVAVTETPVLTPEQDQPLLKALGRGIYWQQLIDSGVVASGTEIAEREGIHRSTVNVFCVWRFSLPTLSRLPTKDGFPGGVAGGHLAGHGALGLE